MTNKPFNATGLFLLALAQFVLATSAATAEDPRITAGTLTCKGKGGVGLIIGSKQALSCLYNPGGSNPNQAYAGTITNIGLDIGIKGESTMVWTVLTSSTTTPSGALAGKYTGVAADASLGLGAGAKILVGGSKNSITLQPLSVQGQTGLNVAIGVSGLELTLP